MKQHNLTNTYKDRSIAFKQISLKNTAKIVSMYWKNLFDCDYYLHFYNLNKYANPLNNYIFFQKKQPPIWDNNNFTFTQSLDSWNESNTLKYHNISIGEFQVHNKRNCFKFRFNIDGILRLIKLGYI